MTKAPILDVSNPEWRKGSFARAENYKEMRTT